MLFRDSEGVPGLYIFRFYYGDFTMCHVEFDSKKMAAFVREHTVYEAIDVIGFVDVRDDRDRVNILNNLIQFFPGHINVGVIADAARRLDAVVVYVSGEELTQCLLEESDAKEKIKHSASSGAVYAA